MNSVAQPSLLVAGDLHRYEMETDVEAEDSFGSLVNQVRLLAGRSDEQDTPPETLGDGGVVSKRWALGDRMSPIIREDFGGRSDHVREAALEHSNASVAWLSCAVSEKKFVQPVMVECSNVVDILVVVEPVSCSCLPSV